MMTTPMNEERVTITRGDDGVAEVMLARPAKMNALDPAMFHALADAIAELGRMPGLRAVVLHGAGRSFCAGLDVAGFAGMADAGSGHAHDEVLADLPARSHGIANLAQHLAWGWRELPVPVIAAVQGVAFGGGLQIALGADIRCVHPEARLSVMEIKWGLVPDMAGCVLLHELVRPDVARELTFSGRMVGGREAVELGLATRLADDPLVEARALARDIAGRSPDAVRAAKRLHNLASAPHAARILMAESVEQQALMGSRNQTEAVSAATDARAPRFVDV